VKIGLGHLGETIPFLLWRFDSRAGPDFYAVKLAKPPSHYFKDNFVVTTSGMCSAEPLICTLSALGSDHVMFAADYPFESAQESAAFIDGAPIADDVRADICFNNAAKLLRLPTS
jgi:2,3-dihydroxybenzoate decarboxylase